MTAFVSLLALDTQRIESRRIDCLPCLTLPAAATLRRRPPPPRQPPRGVRGRGGMQGEEAGQELGRGLGSMAGRSVSDRSYGGYDPALDDLNEDMTAPLLQV